MGIIKKCDVCDKESPDKEGKHIGNKWFEVNISQYSNWFWNVGNVYNEKELLFCKECFSKIIGGNVNEKELCQFEYHK